MKEVIPVTKRFIAVVIRPTFHACSLHTSSMLTFFSLCLSLSLLSLMLSESEERCSYETFLFAVDKSVTAVSFTIPTFISLLHVSL